jgi:hypothetical protein
MQKKEDFIKPSWRKLTYGAFSENLEQRNDMRLVG